MIVPMIFIWVMGVMYTFGLRCDTDAGTSVFNLKLAAACVLSWPFILGARHDTP